MNPRSLKFRPSRPEPVLPENVPPRLWSRAELRRGGATPRDLTTAVRSGLLLRPRRGAYLPSGTDPQVVEAVRCRGRIDCVTLLRRLSVFVVDDRRLHMQIDPHSTRVAEPDASTVRHWRSTGSADDATVTSVVEALVQAVRCQPPRVAIATLDSAWNVGLLDEESLSEVFEALPLPHRRLRNLLDPRAESGIETLVRLILRSLGCHVELQAAIPDVGFVDLLVDGWLIVECDSRAYHGSWDDHRTDRRRDAAAVAQGFTTVRLLAEDVLHRPEWVREALRRALSHRPVHNSGKRRTRRS